MKELVLHTKKRSVIICGLSLFLMIVIVFIPLGFVTKTNNIENFQSLASAKKQAVLEICKSHIGYTEEFSNQLDLKNDIIRYFEGNTSWQELQAETDIKYQNAILDNSNLVQAVRFIEGRQLSGHKEDQTCQGNGLELFEDCASISSVVFSESDCIIMAICSPIIHDGIILGHDIMLFDITDGVQSLQDGNFIIRFPEKEDMRFTSMRPGRVYENQKLQGENYICVVYELPYGGTILIGNLMDDVFSSTYYILIGSVICIFIGLFINYIVLSHSVIKIANRELRDIDVSRNVYMKYANYDILTGAFSRIFFETWVDNTSKKNNEEQCLVAMVDVDHFKNINDEHGHKTGDEVLKYIASSLMASIRKDDFVIRYGGDEFLIVFQNVNELDAREILNRVCGKLLDDNKFGFPIEISFGLESVDQVENVHEAIEAADKKMYNCKSLKKK